MINRMNDIFSDILLILFVIFVVGIGYRFATDDDEDDGDSVTITYSCTTVLNSIEKYDAFLVQQCTELKEQK